MDLTIMSSIPLQTCYLKPMQNIQTCSFCIHKKVNRRMFKIVVSGLSNNGAVPRSSPDPTLSTAVQDSNRQRGSLESLFCYDKSIPEEIIEKPIGLAVDEKVIGEKSPCPDCQAKGVVLCRTCSGSGLYIDSIMESQGIIVKVRCLGCGGTGNIMCSDCGGRGHP